MKKIKLKSSPKHILVDDEDYERCLSVNWYTVSSGGEVRGYIGITKDNPRGEIQIANFVMGDIGESEFDHKDRNPFNNQKDNLRKCTHSQNSANRIKYKQNTSSKYKGVYWRKHRHCWGAKIEVDKQQIHLGSFKREIDAALVYNEAALNYFGEFAIINKFEGN